MRALRHCDRAEHAVGGRVDHCDGVIFDAKGDRAMVTRQGYHPVHWRAAGMSYWAVANLNPGELQEFVRAVQDETSLPASL
jgi:hypothetical protein